MLTVEQSMDVAFVIAGKLREGTERNFNGMRKAKEGLTEHWLKLRM